MDIDKIYTGNCLIEMDKISDESIDCIITDPPFKASNSKMIWKEKSYSSLNEDWDKIDDLDKFNQEWISKSFKKLKEGGSMLIYCSHHNLSSVWNAVSSAGFQVRNLLTWFRPDNMPMKRAYLGFFAYSSLWMLFCTKGKIKTWNYQRMKELNNGIQMRDMFVQKLNCSSKIYHPTQKPLNQIKDFVEILSNKEDLILDPFVGGGTTAIACKELKRHFIGIEQSEEYVKVCEDRLSAIPQTQALLKQSRLICVKEENQK